MISGSALTALTQKTKSLRGLSWRAASRIAPSASDSEEPEEYEGSASAFLREPPDNGTVSTAVETPSQSIHAGSRSRSFMTKMSKRRGENSSSNQQIAEILADYKGATARNELLAGPGRRAGATGSLRRQLYCLLDEPDSSIWASIIAWTIFLLILLSTTTYCIETLPGIANDCDALRTLYILDAVTVSIFTVEYFLRWFVSPNRLSFPVQYKNIIDLVAIIPFYISPTPVQCTPEGEPMDSGGISNVDLRFLRLLRVFRTFKLSGYGPQLELVSTAVRESQEMLMMFLINLMIVIIIFSSMIYLCENKYPNTKFTSIPASCWWAIVTVLTVGYGDMAPETVPGKLVASLLMIIALVVIALPVSIIGTNFTLEWERNKGEQKAVNRAAQFPGKLKQIYPHMELWMDELGRHCSDLKKETKRLKQLSQDMQTAAPESQMAHLDSITNAAEAVSKLTSNDILESVTLCGKVIRQIEKFQIQLMDLNEKGKSELEVGLKVVQESFAGALMRMGAMDEAASPTASAPSVQEMQKDLSKYHGVAVFEVVGCKGIGGSVSKFKDIPDPYVAMTSGNETAKTTVVQNSSSPLFDELVMLLVEDCSVPVSIDVWDKEYFTKDEFMGSHKLKVRIDSPDWTEAMKLRLTHNGKPSGIVMLRYQYHSFKDMTEEKLKDPGLWPKLLSLATSVEISEAFAPVLPTEGVVSDDTPDGPVLTRLDTDVLEMSTHLRGRRDSEVGSSGLPNLNRAISQQSRDEGEESRHRPKTSTGAVEAKKTTPGDMSSLSARRVSFPTSPTALQDFSEVEASERGSISSRVHPQL